MDIYFHLEHSFLKCLSTYSSFVNNTRNTHSEYYRTIWNSSKIMHCKEVKGKTVSIEVQFWHNIARCNESIVNVLEMEQSGACHGQGAMHAWQGISWEQWSRYCHKPRMLTKTIYTVWTTLQIQSPWKADDLLSLQYQWSFCFIISMQKLEPIQSL